MVNIYQPLFLCKFQLLCSFKNYWQFFLKTCLNKLMNLFGETEAAAPQNYTVLARKYRPVDLDGLIGQDALVRTLRNAISSGRLAHAFLLTGIRGVGKTTTARIIARTINNIPASESLEGHIDIIEMDAASNRGIDDIREIIGEARYKPVQLAYKVYIIDEVHMLTKEAFNALLKTLEEPPPHVKFIFATTEIRKVPVTILSRCQRFDLRRVDSEVLAGHLRKIADNEKVEVEDAAINMLVNASEGSVRDSLSLFDQAIAYSEGKVTLSLVQQMLGYADKTQIIALYELIVSGNIAAALELFSSICQTSAEPHQVVHELLDFSHLVTRLNITPQQILTNVTEAEGNAARALAAKLSMPVLTRIWQMLLKAFNEVKFAPNPKQAAEMAIIRLAYSTDLPEPGDLIKDLKKNSNTQPVVNQRPVITPERQPEPAPAMQLQKPVENIAQFETKFQAPENAGITSPSNFNELMELFRQKKEYLLLASLRTEVHLVSFKPERLEIRLVASAPKDFTTKLMTLLNNWTGKRWVVIISSEEGAPTVEEQEKQNFNTQVELAKNDPLVKEILENFPGSSIKSVNQSINEIKSAVSN